MSQCVPNWDVDDDAPNAAHPRLSFLGVASASASASVSAAAAMSPPGPELSSVDYEVAELTWENGQLSMQCLGNSRLNSKPTATVGTLESLVNQATSVGDNAIPPAGCKPSFSCAAELVPWFDPSKAPTDVVATASTTMTMDVLVPCAAAAGTDDPHRQAVWLLGDSVAHGAGACRCCSTHVGSCSAMGGGNGLLNPEEEEQRQEVNRKQTSCSGGDWGNHHSPSGSATYSHPVTTQDTYESEREPENATSQGSPEKMSCGKGGKGRATTTATTEEHDSVYSRPQREAEEKRRLGKSSLSTRRSRAAAIHNQSERKRRDKINQRMKTLQKLVPNSSKTDKASVLDEVIDYLKQLQAQVQMMSRMNVPVPPMMLPLTMQQQLQLSMMMPMGLGLGLAGMPGVMTGDMSGLSGKPPNTPGIPPSPSPAVLHPFMPVFPWDGTPGDRSASGPAATITPDLLSAFLASQSSPAMTLDAYTRLTAAMFHQQMRQQPPSNPNN